MPIDHTGSTGSAGKRRAIIIGKYETDAPGLDELITRHRLEVVFTVYAPSAPKPAALVTVQHILEHDADVVIIQHLTAAEIRAEELWRAVAGLADIVTSDGTWLRS
ncbi:hypothetical protein [Nocardia sp. CA-290969]|uniref:hypothetical protein n=1 Tax=Nocardia sp. CA-290969 TaxID=3239986 RepID=UPI003D8C4B3A